MAGMYTQDKIENWVSDFVVSDGMRGFSGPLKEIAGEVLVNFLTHACEARGIEPDEIEENDARSGLLEGVAKLAVPENAKKEVPALCGAFLAFLESEGRLGGGRAMGAFVGALAGAYQDTTSAKVKPIVRAGSKIGRNDPCPCGSGKKYKKCCMGDGG